MINLRSSRPEKQREYPADQWERLWFTLSDGPWRSLAVVGAQNGPQALEAANGLRTAAAAYSDVQVTIIDATGIAPSELAAVQDALADGLWAGQRVIMALGNPLQHSPSIPLARATDSVVLCVALAKSQIETARLVVKCIGERRFIGSITMEP